MKSTTRMLLVSAALLAAPAAANAEAPRAPSPMQRLAQLIQPFAPAARTATSTAASTAAAVARPTLLQPRTGNTKRPSYDGTVACDITVPLRTARRDVERDGE